MATGLDASGYRLQYSGVDMVAMASLAPSVFITEGAPGGGFPAISDVDVGVLQAKGTLVLGYVNAAVTDDTRPWWNPAWTDDGTDLGSPTLAAPAWLADQPVNAFGIVADYSNAGWKQIVIDQAVDLVTRGYDGVFLDDVAQYFVAGATASDIRGQATLMMELVCAVSDAIHQVNPAAKVIVNATPYITGDGTGGSASTASQAFLAKVDAMLIESFFGINRVRESAAITVATSEILPHMAVLALEYGGTLAQAAGFFGESLAAGFASFNAMDAGYDTTGRTFLAGTASADHILGSGVQNVILAMAGDDGVTGGKVADWLDGGRGRDQLTAGKGADWLIGGSGDDRLDGGLDRAVDHFIFHGRNFGRDQILHFDGTRDRIDISDAAANMADLSIRQVGQDVVVSFDGLPGLSIRIDDVLRAEIGRDDFLFG